MDSATDLLVWGAVAHLGADWLLQNEWMALNKTKPGHPAGHLHALIHGISLSVVFPLAVAFGLAVVHWVIDLRFPLAWWRRVFGQTTEGPMAPHVAVWGDQVLHVLCIAGAARIVA